MTAGNGEVRELPKGWKWTQLNNLGDIVSGGTPSTKIEEYWSDEISWVSPADLSGYTSKFISRGRKSLSKLGLENSSAKLIPAGSILFSSRAPIGYVVISANEVCTNQGFKSLIPSEGIFNEYVYYYLKASKQLAEKYASGTTFKELSGKSFSILPIPLPPFNEQERIVEKIEELFSDVDQGVESLKTAQKQLKVYRQAVLKWAFEGKLTEAWRQQQTDVSPVILNAAQQSEESQTNANDRDSSLRVHSAQNDIQRLTGEALLAQIKAERENRYQQQLAEWEEKVREWEAIEKVGKKPTKLQSPKDFPSLTLSDSSNLPKLPNNWCWERAGNIFNEINNGYTPAKEKLNPGNGEVPFLKVYNLTHNGSLDFKDLTFISRETHKLELTRSIVYPNDVLFNIVGPPLGKVSLVPPKYSEYNINQAVVAFRPNKYYLAKFLMYALLTKSVISWILSTGKATAGQTNLKVSSCREQPLPVCSIEEQEQIVQEIESRLSVCDRLEATIIENLQKAEALRQSILKQAFEGKLVPQDPNDEPAEQLLERIKQEKANPSKDN